METAKYSPANWGVVLSPSASLFFLDCVSEMTQEANQNLLNQQNIPAFSIIWSKWYWWNEIQDLWEYAPKKKNTGVQIFSPYTLWLKTAPCLVWLSGLRAGLQTKRSPVRFPLRAHAWVAGQVPNLGRVRGNHSLHLSNIDVSLPLFLLPFPSL